MAARRNNRRGAGRGFLRLLGYITGILLFGIVVFLFTSCRPAPKTSYVRQDHPQAVLPRSEAPSQHERHRDSEQAQTTDTPPVQQVETRAASPAPETPAEEPTVTEEQTENMRPALPHNTERPDVAVLQHETARGNKGSRKIAITFDAGADSRPTAVILNALAKHNIHATFFLTGKFIEKNPSLTRRIAAEGHEIGNHTYSHKRLTSLTDGEIEVEVDKVEQQVLRLTGRSTKPLLRVPYGARDSHVLSVLASMGYTSVYWDIDSWDSVKAGITSEEIGNRVLGKIRNGSIVLMHCGSMATADELDPLLQQLQSEGYQPVTVSALLND